MSERLQTDQPILKEAEETARLVEDCKGDAAGDCTADAGDDCTADAGDNCRGDAVRRPSEGSSNERSSAPPVAPINSARRRNKGLIRHRLIISACLAFSACLLALSLADVKSLVQYQASVDEHMKVTREAPALSNDNSMYIDRTACEGFHRVQHWAQRNWKWGFTNEKGEVVVPLEFDQLGPLSEGLAAAKPDDDRLFGYIDKKGKLVIGTRFQQAQEFHAGVAPVRLVEGADWAFIDHAGKVLRKVRSQPNYIEGTNAWVAANVPDKDGGRSDYGVIDAEGKWIVQPVYSEVRIGLRNRYWFYDLNESGFRFPENEEATFLQIRGHNRLWGIADLHGKILAEPRFNDIRGYNDGYVTFRQNKKCGISAVDGKILIPAVHDEVTTYGDVIGIKDNGKWYFVGRDGRTLSNFTAKALIKEVRLKYWFSDGLGPVVIGDKCGYVSRNGALAIPAKFDFAMPFHNGFAAVFKDGYWRYIDVNGKLMSPKFTELTNFERGKTQVFVPGPLYQFAKGQDIERMKKAITNLKASFSKTLFEPQQNGD